MAYYNDQAFAAPPTGNLFGTLDPNWSNGTQAPFGRDFYDNANNGQYGYEQFANGMTGGTNSDSRFGDFLRNRYSRTYSDYGAAAAQNPGLRWTDYLGSQQSNMQNEYLGRTPIQNGESAQRPLKWL